MTCATDPVVAKAKLRSRIRAAEDAYDRLILGTAPRVIVDGPGGERVEFQAANAQRLENHIATLKAEMTQLEGGAYVHPKATRPMSFLY